jgi:hypothetical protein
MGHSWFQHVLASNESKHPGWMKVSSFIETLVSNDLATKKAANPFEGSYKTYSRQNLKRTTIIHAWRQIRRKQKLQHCIVGEYFIAIRIFNW